MTEGDAYSAVADEQLDAFEAGPDIDLYDAMIDACDLVLNATDMAKNLSTAITTPDGIILRLPVAGHPPYAVFWSPAGPRIEAVFPHE